jgi:hypothetical protein
MPKLLSSKLGEIWSMKKPVSTNVETGLELLAENVGFEPTPTPPYL